MNSMGKKSLISYRFPQNSQIKIKTEKLFLKEFSVINASELVNPLEIENRDTNMAISCDSRDLINVFSQHLGNFAVAMDGVFINHSVLMKEMLNKNQIVRRMSNEEILASLILNEATEENSWTAIMKHILDNYPGGYSFIIMTKNRIYGARDCYGIKPLVLGVSNDIGGVIEYDVIDGKPVVKPKSPNILASDSVMLNKVNAKYIRQVLPGEIVELSDNGLKSLGLSCRKSGDASSLCSLEYVSLSEPSTIVDDQRVQNVHYIIGQSLAIDSLDATDCVTSLPNISQAFLYGFAEVSKLPIVEAFYYVTTTDEGTLLNVYIENVINKKISLVIDSPMNPEINVVILLLKKSGVKEIHLRFCCPPIIGNCPFGIEINSSELSTNDITSIRYLKLEALSSTISKNIENKEIRNVGHCFHCFGGVHNMLKSW